jgi:hypothetical protein
MGAGRIAMTGVNKQAIHRHRTGWDARAAEEMPPGASMILMFSPEHKIQKSLKNFFYSGISPAPSRILNIHEISGNDGAKRKPEKKVVIPCSITLFAKRPLSHSILRISG